VDIAGITGWVSSEYQIDIYNYNKSTSKGVNCRHLTIALNEMYLSMGILSRYVTCLPKDENDQDCHVINSVYSTQLQKWLWIDPRRKLEQSNQADERALFRNLYGKKSLLV
jgi:hypothetical protein